MFDGLDEISHDKREKTYDFVETLKEKYPKINILLSARNSVENVLEESFCYEIVPMTMRNINKFILYWHRSVLRKDAVINDEKIESLQHNLVNKIVESQPLKLLARNPLLCAMICALNFVNYEHLPEDKMELYEKCCEMLVDSRDAQREIKYNFYNKMPKLDYSRKRSILEEIAFWMMNGDVSSVKRQQILEFIEHLQKDTNILGQNEICSGEELLNYFVERSGIIREPEEGTIDFIHKTFMEYLAVQAICRNCAWNVLIKEACNVNWKETIVMSFRKMGAENVKHVLERLVEIGKSKHDDRYFLIASLGAANAVFLADDKIKREIDNRIKAMIPPTQDAIFEMLQAGTYLLPFLRDSDCYTNEEKERCLKLLDYLETEEAIPNILTFIAGNGNNSVKIYALDTLNEFGCKILDEYNVKEEIKSILIDSIKQNSLTVYEGMINMLDEDCFSNNEKIRISNIESLNIICGGNSETAYEEQNNILWKLKKCTKIFVRGKITNINFLKYCNDIKELYIYTEYDLSNIVTKFGRWQCLMNTQQLCIRAKTLKYFCKTDIERMKSLTCIELHCPDRELELDFSGLDNLKNLKKVILNVHELLAYEMQNDLENMKAQNPKCEFICSSISNLSV